MITRSTYCPTCQTTKKMTLESDDCLYCLVCGNNPSHQPIRFIRLLENEILDCKDKE